MQANLQYIFSKSIFFIEAFEEVPIVSENILHKEL